MFFYICYSQHISFDTPKRGLIEITVLDVYLEEICFKVVCLSDRLTVCPADDWENTRRECLVLSCRNIFTKLRQSLEMANFGPFFLLPLPFGNIKISKIRREQSMQFKTSKLAHRNIYIISRTGERIDNIGQVIPVSHLHKFPNTLFIFKVFLY